MVITSLYGNPLHEGHIDYLCAARRLGTFLVVIVNTDEQSFLKKNSCFLPLKTRLAVIAALRWVDLAIPSLDKDLSVCRTVSLLLGDVFANGGDVTTPSLCREYEVCEKTGTEMIFGVGGGKANSSSNLLRQGYDPLRNSPS